MFNLSELSPEEKKILMEHLQKDEHPDIQEDAKFLEPIVQALELIADRLDQLEEKQGLLEKIVMDDIIGNISSAYKDSERLLGIDDLKKSYGSMFDPYSSAYKVLIDDEGADIYEKLYDVLDELKEEEGYSDELKDSKIKELAEALKQKVSSLKSISLPEEKPAEAAEVKIEAAGEPDKIEEMLQKIKEKKEKGGFKSSF